jgi:hypothetical protein
MLLYLIIVVIMAKKSVRKVVLAAPHPNEHSVVLPFRKVLAEKLRGAGLQIEERTTTAEDLHWHTLRRNSNPKTPDEVRILDIFLDVLDTYMRLKTAQVFQSSNASFLELHATPHEPRAFDLLSCKWTLFDGFYSIESVGGLLVSDAKLGVSFSQNAFDSNPGFVRILERQIGITLDQMLKEIASFDLSLSITVIELLGNVVPLVAEDSNRDLYFSAIGTLRDGLGPFEEQYCTKTVQNANRFDPEAVAEKILEICTG